MALWGVSCRTLSYSFEMCKASTGTSAFLLPCKGIFVRLRGTRKHLTPVCWNLRNSLIEFVHNKLVDK